MKTSEALDQAADLIDERGLFKGMNRGALSGECVFTALGSICSGEKAFHQALDLMSQKVGVEGSAWLTAWNDAPETTPDDVVETLRKCAAEARWTEK